MEGFVDFTDQDVNLPYPVPGNPEMSSYQERNRLLLS
jgi:hypothetical protein